MSICLLATISQGAETRARLRFQIGEEYDTNVYHAYRTTENDPPGATDREEYERVAPDGLTRLLFQPQFEIAIPFQRVSFDYSLGAKIFHHQTNAHLVANWLQIVYQYDFSKFFFGGVHLVLQDETLAVHYRDYRLHQADLFERVEPLDWLKIELSEGGRYFLFKPDRETKSNADSNTELADTTESLYREKYSYSAPVVVLRLTAGREQDLSGGLLYEINWRFFQGKALDHELKELSSKRYDTRHCASGWIRYQLNWLKAHQLIIEGSYIFTHNQSNNAGSTFQWHRLRFLVSMQLPADFSMHVMGSLQFANYPDGILGVGSATDPEADENENALVVKLAYHIGNGVSLVLNGGLYRNNFSSGGKDTSSFKRETVMGGVEYSFSP